MSYFRTGTTNMGIIKFRLGWHGGLRYAKRAVHVQGVWKVI